MRRVQQANRVQSHGRSKRRQQPYHSKFCATAKALCYNGATDSELAEAFKVTVRTIEAWRLAHTEFFEACELRQYAMLDRLVRRLYERGLEGDVAALKIMIFMLERKAPDKGGTLAMLLERIQG